ACPDPVKQHLLFFLASSLRINSCSPSSLRLPVGQIHVLGDSRVFRRHHLDFVAFGHAFIRQPLRPRPSRRLTLPFDRGFLPSFTPKEARFCLRRSMTHRRELGVGRWSVLLRRSSGAEPPARVSLHRMFPSLTTRSPSPRTSLMIRSSSLSTWATPLLLVAC